MNVEVSLNTPVLFVVFNRPDTTERVFEAIKKAKPPRLYVAADGPRPGREDDIDKCRLTREVATAVDWDCKVMTLFRDVNVGCGLGPSLAYDWFFEHEEEGIILEDDCLPDQSFFLYCQEMLEKYRGDSRIMHIAGTNFQYGWKRDDEYSYYFSTFPHEWGWATWRSAWRLYDFKIKKFDEIRSKNYLDDYFTSKLERKYRLSKIGKSYNNPDANWWDYQWGFALIINHGLSIIPNVNLVENIGFGVNATHTISSEDPLKENRAAQIQFPLKHPEFMIHDKVSDRRFFRFFVKRIVKRKIFSLLGVKGYNFWG